MKITRSTGIQLFSALGYNATSAWTNERLQAKLEGLPKLIDEKKKKDLGKKSKDLSAVLDKVILALEDDSDGIQIVDTADKKPAKPAAAIKNTDPKKKPKPAPEPEEDDDAEDDDDGAEEDDSEDADDDGDESDEADAEESDEDSDDEEDDEADEGADEVEDADETDLTELKVGDRVEHEDFGTCTVKKISGTLCLLMDDDGDAHKKVPVTELTKLEEEEEEEADEDEDEDDTGTEDEADDEDETSDEDADDDDDQSDDSEEDEDEDDTTDEDDDMADEVTAPAKKPAAKKADPKAAKGGKTAPAKNGKPDPKAKAGGKGNPSNFKKAGGDGKPGVIASILELLGKGTEQKPVTKQQILDGLTKRFPERSADAMKSTLGIQLPARLRTAGHNIQKNENGYWIKAGKSAAKKPEAAAPKKKPAAK